MKAVLALAATAIVAFAYASTATAADRASAALDWRGDQPTAGAFGDLLRTAQTDGSVQAIVGLKAYWTAEGALSETERQAQRTSLASLRAAVLASLGRDNYTLRYSYERLPLVALELTPAGVTALRDSGLASHVQEDAISDVQLDRSTALIEATETATLNFGGNGQRIGVIDSGVDANHPFLAGRVESWSACFSATDCPGGASFFIGPNAAAPCGYAPQSSTCQHGTHVAGIAAGSGGVFNTNLAGPAEQFNGVAPAATIVPVKASTKMITAGASSPCWPDLVCPRFKTTDMIAGLDWLYAAGNVDVVNISLGGTYYADQLACEVGEFASLPAIKQFVVDDIPVVVASGNGGNKSALKAPACIQGVISVGDNTVPFAGFPETVNPSSSSAPFLTLLAPGTQQPDPAAPGGPAGPAGIWSSLNGTYGTMGGTSMAAPHVAGALAVLRSAHPNLPTEPTLVSALKQTGVPFTDVNGVTTPRIRLLSALVSLGDTGFEMSWAKVLPGGKLFSNGASARTMAKSPAMITISGIPAGDVVKSAHLYFMTAGAADSDASMSINGSLVAGTLVGASRAPCTVVGGGAARVYHADVTAFVSGNGSYLVNGITPRGVGVSLVVVTSTPGSTLKKHVLINAGALTAQTNETMMHAFDLLITPPQAIDFHVGIGDGDVDSEDPMKLGGNSTFGSNAFSGSDGGDWDDRTTFMTGAMANPAGDLENSIKTGGDCLAWAYAGIAYKLN